MNLDKEMRLIDGLKIMIRGDQGNIFRMVHIDFRLVYIHQKIIGQTKLSIMKYVIGFLLIRFWINIVKL